MHSRSPCHGPVWEVAREGLQKAEAPILFLPATHFSNGKKDHQIQGVLMLLSWGGRKRAG